MKLRDEVRRQVKVIKENSWEAIAAMRELITIIPEPVANEIMSLQNVYSSVGQYGIDLYMPWNLDMADYIGRLLEGSGLKMTSDRVSNDGTVRTIDFSASWKGAYMRPGINKFVSINMSATNSGSTCVMEEIEPETITRKRWKVRCGDLK